MKELEMKSVINEVLFSLLLDPNSTFSAHLVSNCATLFAGLKFIREPPTFGASPERRNFSSLIPS